MNNNSTTFCAECHTIDGCICVRGKRPRRNDPVRLLLSEIIGNGNGAGRNPQLMIVAAKKLRTILANSSRVPEPTVSTPPAADAGAPCTLADRVGTSAAIAQAATTMREAAVQACRHTREVIGAATGSSIAMALAEAEDRIRALPDRVQQRGGSTLGQSDRSIAERTQAEMDDVAEAEREACIRILEDLRPRNDQSDWTEFTVFTDTVLRLAIEAINARYPGLHIPSHHRSE